MDAGRSIGEGPCRRGRPAGVSTSRVDRRSVRGRQPGAARVRGRRQGAAIPRPAIDQFDRVAVAEESGERLGSRQVMSERDQAFEDVGREPRLGANRLGRREVLLRFDEPAGHRDRARDILPTVDQAH